jgi:hypothetical protein
MEKADSPAIVKHGMDILKKITKHLNPGQTPVLACDCPIFAFYKKIQWNFPQSHREDKFVVMFGGLYLEKGLWTALWKYLRRLWMDGCVNRFRSSYVWIGQLLPECISHYPNMAYASSDRDGVG